MDPALEQELIAEVLELKQRNLLYLDEKATRHAATRYYAQDVFEAEQAMLRKNPFAICLSSEVSNPGDFITRTIYGQSILVTRDKQGWAQAFLNVCRHRGARLVGEEKGCKHAFSCPYHAWTNASDGRFVKAPHYVEGFDGRGKDSFGLKEFATAELYGFIWVIPTLRAGFNFEAHFTPLAEDLQALQIDQMQIMSEDTGTRSANWKILVEGGIEAYHFKVAHKDTIAPYFEDNRSTYRCFGPHMRSVLPRVSMENLQNVPKDQLRLRDHANVLYTLFPTTQMLVQQDHIVWIQMEPLSPGETRLRISTIAKPDPEKGETHWEKNHAITMKTLDKDFVIGEGIQASLEQDPDQEVVFGRFEGALEAFSQSVKRALK